MPFAVFRAVMSSNKLMRSAMVGFLLGVVVVTGVALMSRQTAPRGGRADALEGEGLAGASARHRAA